MVNIFITGATGYIGGDALYALANAHPEYHVTALVRTKEKGDAVLAQYPRTRLVYGSLEDYELLVEEVSRADITLHLANCEHEAGAKAIAAGILGNPSGYVIHLSGSDLICFPDVNVGTYGKQGGRIFEAGDIEEILAPENNAAHREVDLAILEAGKKGAKTAIVCPPTIYGPGRGPSNQRSIQVPELASHILQRRKGLIVEDGQNIWSAVHVHDVSDMFLRFTQAAAGGGNGAHWSAGGFHFIESGDFSWGAVSEAITKEAYSRGLLSSEKLDRLSAEEVDKVWGYGSFFWGTNSRCRAEKKGEVLGWKPSGKDVFTTIADAVAAEATALGLL